MLIHVGSKNGAASEDIYDLHLGWPIAMIYTWPMIWSDVIKFYTCRMKHLGAHRRCKGHCGSYLSPLYAP